LLVIKDLKENRYHDIKDTGAYEWWYFDCIDEDNEYSFVAIFLVGNPFSPEYSERIKNHLKYPESEKPDPMDHCAVSFNLYFQGRVLFRILYEYENDMFKTEQERGNEKISIERNNFYFDKTENKYYLNINLPEPDSNNNFKSEFIFTVKSDPAILKSTGSEKNSNHFWLPAANVCEVSGKFKFYKNYKRTKTEFTGHGYHDHNWGNEAMFQNIKDWYWGRVVTDNYSLVYFYILYNDEKRKPFKMLYIYKEGKLIYELNDFEIELKSKKNYWFLSFNKSLVIKTEDVKVICKNKDRIDNGPFYIRFISRFDLSIKDKKVLSDVPGFSEYIKPSRFKYGFFKPFVNLRIKKISAIFAYLLIFFL